ncbi:MAG: DotI/IcmL family type IV secretion protein [Legionella sp.]
MKNTILWSALFALIGTQVHADITQPVTQPPQNATVPSKVATPPQPGHSAPTVHPGQAAPVPAPIINCEYKIPATTKTIDQSLVLTWTEKAVTQAFDFDSNNLDTQLQKLQDCFTEQGWTGFNTALQKSGNLDAIKSQKLTVSSQVDWQVVVTEAKDNQWKLNVPLQVVYQNDKEKVTQLLSVDLTVGRKVTGDLGITQMIAAPRGTVTQEKSGHTTNPAASGTSNFAPSPTVTQPKTTTPEPTQPAPTTTQPTVTQPAPTATQPTQQPTSHAATPNAAQPGQTNSH